MTADIYPIFDRVVSREFKEVRFGHKSKVIWFYGLSGSGKSTLAAALEHRLCECGFATALLDGDNLRSGLNRDLSFNAVDREENLRRVAEVSKLFVQAGIVTLCSFITPFRSHRRMVRRIIGDKDFIEVYVAASLETCARRDPKGLYRKAARGGLRQFTGVSSPFEPPDLSPRVVVVATEENSIAASVGQLQSHVLSRLKHRRKKATVGLKRRPAR
jgi:adenylylsulfate kinase